MFSVNDDSPGLMKMIKELNTCFDKEILKRCEKEIGKHIIPEDETIVMGVILSKVLDLNGVPKTHFIKRLNRTPVYKRKQKDEKVIYQLLSTKFQDLSVDSLFTDTCEIIRQILFHCNKEQYKNGSKWMAEYSNGLIDCLTNLKFQTNNLVQMEESCYSIAIIVYKFNSVFAKHYQVIINFLLMIVTEGTSIVQHYVDVRNDKLRETVDYSFDHDKEQMFHYPQFAFENNNCLNKQMSLAYFALAFCLDCCSTPESILYLLSYAINTKEVCRYYLVCLLKSTILSLEKNKCKQDPEWMDLPWRIHNELIKLYIDKNSMIRNMASEISNYIKQCSIKKLPFITKPVLDTVEIMTKVIEQKRNESYARTDNEDTEINIWKKWLDLDKKILKTSDESESGESSSPKSKSTVLSVEEEAKGTKTVSKLQSELFSKEALVDIEILPQHTRKTITLPNLKSLMALTKLRTQKSRKANVKKSKVFENEDM